MNYGRKPVHPPKKCWYRILKTATTDSFHLHTNSPFRGILPFKSYDLHSRKSDVNKRRLKQSEVQYISETAATSKTSGKWKDDIKMNLT